MFSYQNTTSNDFIAVIDCSYFPKASKATYGLDKTTRVDHYMEQIKDV